MRQQPMAADHGVSREPQMVHWADVDYSFSQP
jgi:hypothetical protein